MRVDAGRPEILNATAIASFHAVAAQQVRATDVQAGRYEHIVQLLPGCTDHLGAEQFTLDQRIAVRYQMTGMTPDETGSYIRHHLQLAGRDGELFSDDAVSQVHEAARGKPRTVNNLAIAALIASYVTGKKIVDQSAARAAINEIISTE